LKFIFSVIACLLLVAGAYSQSVQPPISPAVEELYLARDDGKGKPGEQVSEFRTTDIPIHCVVLLDISAAATIKMNFVAVNVSGVKADTKVVTASYTTRENQNRVNFTGRPDELWTPGKYRVDIFVDGKMDKSIEFNIVGNSGVVPRGGKSLPRKIQKPPQGVGKIKPKT
jgi:hypothetical protein